MVCYSGEDLRLAFERVKPGEICTLKPGVYEGGARLDTDRVTLRGEDGAVIRGGRDYGLKVEASNVTVENLRLEDGGRFGLQAVFSDFLRLVGVQVRNANGPGILTGNSSDVTAQECVCEGSKTSHGIYFSQSGDRLRILRCTASDNRGCGVQVNALEDRPKRKDPDRDARSRDVLLAENVLERNGNCGAQFASVWNSRVIDNIISDCRQGIVFWDDGAGAKWGCRDADVRRNRIENCSVGISLGRGSRDIRGIADNSFVKVGQEIED